MPAFSIVQTKTPGRENYLVWWYHHPTTTATAQANPNIAFTMLS
jgi:hypothetical protein